jgi:hypothetical protein
MQQPDSSGSPNLATDLLLDCVDLIYALSNIQMQKTGAKGWVSAEISARFCLERYAAQSLVETIP